MMACSSQTLVSELPDVEATESRSVASVARRESQCGPREGSPAVLSAWGPALTWADCEQGPSRLGHGPCLMAQKYRCEIFCPITFS